LVGHILTYCTLGWAPSRKLSQSGRYAQVMCSIDYYTVSPRFKHITCAYRPLLIKKCLEPPIGEICMGLGTIHVAAMPAAIRRESNKEQAQGNLARRRRRRGVPQGAPLRRNGTCV
jgi:hypothetical protein